WVNQNAMGLREDGLDEMCTDVLFATVQGPLQLMPQSTRPTGGARFNLVVTGPPHLSRKDFGRYVQTSVCNKAILADGDASHVILLGRFISYHLRLLTP
ncbi:hypothetical protein P7K49_007205, partial [Saguinus oedipus]